MTTLTYYLILQTVQVAFFATQITTMFNKTDAPSRGGSSFGGSDRPRRSFSSARPSSSRSSTSSRPSSSRSSGGFGSRPVSTSDRFSRPAPSRGGSRFGGSRGGGSSFGGRPRSGGFGGRGRKFNGEHIDISRFINRATTTIEEIYTPTHTFSDFKVDSKLKDNIARRGFVVPSPIQDQAIPNALDGRDIIGLANTGTGKTAAFLIPTINKILHDKKHKAIIITPTRELAIQIQKECIELTKLLGIFNVTCVGGAPIGPQIKSLSQKHNIVIGTPGRLKDLLDRKFLNISDVTTVVFDEADRMLDMGFIDDVKYFLKQIPSERQMLLFSATGRTAAAPSSTFGPTT